MFPTDQTIGVVDLAREIERRGFESLWLTEHTHIPVHRAPNSPAGGDLAEFYARTLDPFVGLTAAAMATSRIRLGFGILLIVQREPIATAKALASLDRISGGRLMCGVGAGWIPEEIANHGTIPSSRFKVLRERVLAMREIWTEDEAEYHGDFVDFDPIWSWPKPLQRPFPLFIGGNTANTLRRVIEAGEGWFPVGNDPAARPQLIEQIAEFRRMCEEAGRGHLPVTIYGPEPSLAALDELRAGGVDRVVLTLSQESTDAARADLDSFARLLD
ncbi:LLM class F420-dependent oxidoreductase [Nocardioides immobilis]|uniref:LLM class F420-dependent oxidoreductase n=1 Tax=Nocardioides immobilis TaxID=2049295 RepID=UPI001C70C37B|nr:LLM class F420-dependent oxidoreductase [Nocardioides immobilis]